MNKELLENIIEKESQKSSLVSKDIPDLDLYMDQIMTLFETHLANNKKNEEDKLLTKTMINNYSKAKVITPVKGKKYTTVSYTHLDVYKRQMHCNIKVNKNGTGIHNCCN